MSPAGLLCSSLQLVIHDSAFWLKKHSEKHQPSNCYQLHLFSVLRAWVYSSYSTGPQVELSVPTYAVGITLPLAISLDSQPRVCKLQGMYMVSSTPHSNVCSPPSHLINSRLESLTFLRLLNLVSPEFNPNQGSKGNWNTNTLAPSFLSNFLNANTLN